MLKDMPITFENLEERKDYLLSTDYIRAALSDDVIERLLNSDFLTAPASTHYHGAYAGGLFDHSVNVAETLRQMTLDLGLRWDSPYAPVRVGLLHDMCKIDQYRWNTYKEQWEYSEFPVIKGHGSKSVMYLLQFMSLTEEEIACVLYHMGAFTEKEEWKDYNLAVNRYPNVLFTHTADMYVSQVLEV